MFAGLCQGRSVLLLEVSRGQKSHGLRAKSELPALPSDGLDLAPDVPAEGHWGRADASGIQTSLSRTEKLQCQVWPIQIGSGSASTPPQARSGFTGTGARFAMMARA